MNHADVIQQLGAAELHIDSLDTSGTLQRCRVEGDRGSKRSGWYAVREYLTRDGVALYWGHGGNWKSGHAVEVTPPRREASELSKAERERIAAQHKADREAAEQARRDVAHKAAERAAHLWVRLPVEGRSPYLDRKKVRAYGLRFARGGGVVVPVRTVLCEWVGLQFIDADGGKKFLTGTAKRGAMHLMGDVLPDKPLVIAEGYATAASIHQATGWPVAVAFDAGNLLPVAEQLRAAYPLPHAIVIAGDDDHATPGNPGRTKAAECAKRIGGLTAFPHFADGPVAGLTDFNDLHVREGLDAVHAQLEAALRAPADTPEARSASGGQMPPAPPPPDDDNAWQQLLRRTNSGEIRAELYNITLILEHDERWRGVLGYCGFSYRIIKRRAPPYRDGATGEWADVDTTRVRMWLAAHWRFSAKADDTHNAVLLVAQAHKFHPVKEYLEGVMWDEMPRVDTWLSRYLGAADTPYTRAVGRYWLIGAVARVMRPPVKVDNVLILEGLQGLGKSTALNILGGEWYSDTHFALGEKDGYQQMQGLWICELAELDSFNKAESTRAKQFFGSKEDRYRPSYGRCVESFPRQCVFAGSTNQENYLKDPTGNRRYWPILCTNLDADALRRDRDQLWAEATELFLRGHRWWPGDKESHLFKDEQERRFAADAWEDLVREFLMKATDETFTVAELAKRALDVATHQLKPPEEQRIGRIMARIGWPKDRRVLLRDGTRVRLWVFSRPRGWGEGDDS